MMKEAFQFQVGWRTYTCKIERQGPGAEAWWWFAVTGDTHRYAPCRATPGDTEAGVRERILAYHTHRLARRAEPPPPRHQAGRPPKAKTAKPASK
jgi:hypothetical protein